MIHILNKSLEQKSTVSLWMNHLLVVFAFLIPVSNRATSAVFVCIIILFLYRGSYLFYLKYSFDNKIVQSFIYLFLIYVIWLIGTDNYEFAKTNIKDMKYLLYPLIFLTFVDKRFSFIIISSFILGMLYSELISYAIHFSILPYKLELFDIVLFKAHAENNPSPFLHHSKYNILISIAVGITLYNMIVNKSTKLIKFISIFFIITASINLTLVGGRIGYFTFVTSIIVTLMIIYRNKIIKVIFPTLIILSLFFYISYSSTNMFKVRVDQTIMNTKKLFLNEPDFNSSLGLRVGVWIYSFEVIKDNIIFGVGTGDQMDEIKKVLLEKHQYISGLTHTHNEYIRSFIQFGIIGLFVLLNIFYQIFKMKIDNIKLKSILFISTIVLAVGMLTDINGSKVLLMFWATIVSATTTTNNYIFKEKIINYKQLLIYTISIILFLILAVLQ